MGVFCNPSSIFQDEGRPILLTYPHDQGPHQAGGKGIGHYHVYMWMRSSASPAQRSEDHLCSPLSFFGNLETGDPVYQMIRTGRLSKSLEAFLAFPTQKEGRAKGPDALDILTCTNGALPERLQFGDLCEQTSDSPELLTFRNLIPPTLLCGTALRQEQCLWNSFPPVTQLSFRPLPGGT